jgi:hypothetical protein
MKTPEVILQRGEMEKGGIVISWFGLAGKKKSGNVWKMRLCKMKVYSHLSRRWQVTSLAVTNRRHHNPCDC